MTKKSFAELFKKNRLRSEFATFSELGMALAEKGLIYEDSIFSRWQKGDRIPNRSTLIKLIEIFLHQQSIKTLEQANEFLESAGEGYLTEKEMGKMKFTIRENAPFQLPHQIDNFTGREELIKGITENISANMLLIQGPPGVGKTVLAIRLGYLLKSRFSDGVLWYRLDTSDVMDVLLSIAFAYGKDVGHIQDKHIRASVVRSVLSDKKVLLIFDNVELKSELSLLLPNSEKCFVIITSKYNNLAIYGSYLSIVLKTFTMNEALLLFKAVLGNVYVNKNKSSILKLAECVGFLPLPLHIFAKELKNNSVSIAELLQKLKQDKVSLHELPYGDKNLFAAINFSFELLDEKTKKVFLSLTVFNGKDFSLETVSWINELSLPETKRILNNLQTISLIEQSLKERFRIHPMIKKFVKEKANNPHLFLKAAKYYIHFLSKFDKAFLRSYPNIKQESDNVLYIFKKCYELHYWDEVISLWNPLETLLYATKQLNKMNYLVQIVKGQKIGTNIFQKMLFLYFCLGCIYLISLYFMGLRTSFWNYTWNIFIALGPLIGGIVGIFIAKSWEFSNSIGKAVLFLSLGLTTWSIGNFIWAYYNIFMGNSVPYPSLADAGYLPSYFLWTVGIMYLPHAIGGKFGFQKWYYRPLIILIPILVLALSYYLVVFITKSGVVFASSISYKKLFFDIAYPISDAVILTAALVIGISFKFFGGKYKWSIYSILIGFLFMYIADFSFSYTTTIGSYYNGTLVDVLFFTAFSLINFGVLGFYSPSEKM